MPSLNDVLAAVSSVTNLFSLIIFTFMAYIVQKLRGDFAIFKNQLLEEIGLKFIQKPSEREDYPLTRREFQQYVTGAKEHRMATEQRLDEIRKLEDRIRLLEFEVMRKKD